MVLVRFREVLVRLLFRAEGGGGVRDGISTRAGGVGRRGPEPPTGVPWKIPEARLAMPWPMKSRLVSDGVPRFGADSATPAPGSWSEHRCGPRHLDGRTSPVPTESSDSSMTASCPRVLGQFRTAPGSLPAALRAGQVLSLSCRRRRPAAPTRCSRQR